jgi:hypothetical protein
MTKVVEDRVLETSTTTGTGALTLLGAVSGYRAFSAVCVNNDTVDYYIEAVDASGVPTGAWETGIGTWGTGNILTRTSVISSSNADTVVTLGVGTKRVGIGLLSKTVDANFNPFLLMGA